MCGDTAKTFNQYALSLGNIQTQKVYYLSTLTVTQLCHIRRCCAQGEKLRFEHCVVVRVALFSLL